MLLLTVLVSQHSVVLCISRCPDGGIKNAGGLTDREKVKDSERDRERERGGENTASVISLLTLLHPAAV